MSSPPLPPLPPVYAFIDVDGSLLNTTFTYFRGKRDKVGSGENQFLEKAAKREREREREREGGVAAASLLKFDRELGAIKISGINVGRDELRK